MPVGRLGRHLRDLLQEPHVGELEPLEQRTGLLVPQRQDVEAEAQPQEDGRADPGGDQGADRLADRRPGEGAEEPVGDRRQLGVGLGAGPDALGA